MISITGTERVTSLEACLMFPSFLLSVQEVFPILKIMALYIGRDNTSWTYGSRNNIPTKQSESFLSLINREERRKN